MKITTSTTSRLISYITLLTFILSILISKLMNILFHNYFYDSMTIVGLLIVLGGLCVAMVPNDLGARNTCAMSKQQTFQLNLYSISFLIAGIVAILFGIAMR